MNLELRTVNSYDWPTFLAAMTLVLVRVSGMVALAPFFSSSSLPIRSRAVFAGAVAYLLAPLVAALPGSRVAVSYPALLGELAVGLVYGLTLSLLNEMLLFAGQIAGFQFSFSLVNLLDPSSSIQTPLLGDLFSLGGTLVVLASGLDRILLASMVRSFHSAPLGACTLAPVSAAAIVRAAGGIFLAAVELAAPVLASTLLVEIAVALLGKLSPQLPVMALTVPLKTLTGFAVLIGSLALWPRFIEARFASLLDLAERLIAAPHGVGG
jgi:flagellar biosynthesis protein FliR